MNYKKLILERKSVRDYKKTTISKKTQELLIEYSKSCTRLIDNITCEIIIKDNDEVYKKLIGAAGYLGKMIDAPHYLIILSEKLPYYIENTGYLGEKLLLKALDLGINSCWITFDDNNSIKEKLGIKSSFFLTGLIALGYDNNKTKVIDITKSGENYSKSNLKIVSDNTSFRYRIQDIVFIKQWGNKASIRDLKLLGILQPFYYARLAPSTLNRQPWRFIVDDNIIVLAIKKDDTSNYNEKIDAGIIMLYFELIVDKTLFDLTWILGYPKYEYTIPDNYNIIGYCEI